MESVFQFWQNVARGTKRLMPLQVFAAQVEDVDEKKRTCTVKVNEGVGFEDVRLYSLTDEGLKGFCLIPKQDSMVLVSRIDNGNELYVTMFSEVDKVLGTIGDKTEVAIDEQSLSYKVEETEVALKSNDIQVKTKGVTFTVSDKKVTVDADEIVFNGGGNGGLVIFSELQKDLKSIKNYVEAMNSAVQAGISDVGESTAASGKAGKAAYNLAMTGKTITLSENMENPDVKH